MSSQTVYLVTGANRGLGFGLVSSLATRENVLVFATARDPSKATDLNKLAQEKGNVVVLKLKAGNEGDAKAAAKEVEEKAGKVDVVIANAGISDAYQPASEQGVAEFTRHFEVNTLGPVVLFQAFKSLLYKSNVRKFMLVSTAGASFGLGIPMPLAAYGASKAAANFYILKLHQEEGKNGLVIFANSPGHVQTDMGNDGARSFGLEQAPVTIEDSVAGQLRLVDEATGETHGGKFWDYTGDAIPW
ncbi:hypothetical protein JCM11641_003976 [Rhodosporidiobolus odoratus]